MKNNSTHSLDASQRIQEKYDFYFLALTFTIVGFAVQTQPNDAIIIARIAELMSWCLFIISGICGMFRIEQKYQMYFIDYSRHIKGEEIRLYKIAIIKGVSEIEYLQAPPKKSTLPVNEKVIAGLQQQMSDFNSLIEKDNLYSKALFYTQKYLFIGGLLSIMISRGIKSFLEIYTSL
ncbi:MAG: hypothetical protein WC967_06145 [Balneolaceae bacterium]